MGNHKEMKNRKPLYDDDELKRLSAQAARWLEGYPDEDTSIDSYHDEYADLKRLAHDISTDITLERRLDSETLSTLRLIALIEEEATASIDKIELPAGLDRRLSAHIRSLAEAEEKDISLAERGQRTWRPTYRWLAAAAIAALAVTGGYRLLQGVPDISREYQTAIVDNTSTKEDDKGKRQDSGKPAVGAPVKERPTVMEKSNIGKRPATVAGQTAKINPEKYIPNDEKQTIAEEANNFSAFPEITADHPHEEIPENISLHAEIAEDNLAMANEICDINLGQTAEEVRQTLGRVAEQTAEMTRTVNENLNAVGNIFRVLQGNLATTRESMQQASASASASSLMTPPTELRIRPHRIKSATASPAEL